MDTAKSLLKMEIDTKATSKTDYSTVKVYSPGRMELCMREDLRITSWKEMGCTGGQTVQSMKGRCRTDSDTVMESLLSILACMRENGRTDTDMVVAK